MSERCKYFNQENAACTFSGEKPSWARELTAVKGINLVCGTAKNIEMQQNCTEYVPTAPYSDVLPSDSEGLIG